jgi:hypothetical protein
LDLSTSDELASRLQPQRNRRLTLAARDGRDSPAYFETTIRRTPRLAQGLAETGPIFIVYPASCAHQFVP